MRAFITKNAMNLGVVAVIAIAAMLRFYGVVPLNDAINGTLESCGGIFIAMSIVALYRAKLVRGVSPKHVTFFTIWGLFNPYYYSSLDQWFSFTGGVFLVAMNSIWLGQIAYYLIKERA